MKKYLILLCLLLVSFSTAYATEVIDFASTGYLVKVCDSASACAYGYIGAAEGGEVLGSELITAQVDRDFSGASGWTNNDINAYDETGDLTITANAADQYCTLPDANAVRVIDKEYKLQLDVANLVDNWTISDEDADFTITGTVTDASTNTIYFTEVDSANIGGFRITSNGNTSSADLDNFTLKEVTTADAYAVTIYKESDLLNEGWLIIDDGFDPNDISTYDIYNVTLDQLEPRTYAKTEGATASIAAEASFTDHGLFNPAPDTNLLLYARDGTNAAWTKSNITPLLDVTGLNDSANSATRLTATGANGTIDQTLSGTPDGTFVVWLKRISGTGSVYITDDDFSTDQEATLTTDWTKFIFAAACGANPVVGVKIATSGDVVAMDYAMVRKWPESPDVIPTTSAPVAITNQVVSGTMEDVLKNILSIAEGDATSQGTLAVTWYPYHPNTVILSNMSIVAEREAAAVILYERTSGRLTSFDGANAPIVTPNWVANTEYKIFSRWDHDQDLGGDGGGDFRVSEKHGGVLTHGAYTDYDGAFNLGTDLLIGYLNPYPFAIKDIKFFNRYLTDAEIGRL